MTVIQGKFGKDREALEAELLRLRELLAELDRQEPREESSEAYEAWADAHEELEDLLDEVLDQMEE